MEYFQEDSMKACASILVDGASNIMESCRICMSREKEMNQLFNKTAELDKVVDKLQFCTGVLVEQNDGLPSQICDVCLCNLNAAYQFKTTCLHSQEMFQNLLEAKVKSEERETNSDYEADGFADDTKFHEIKQEIKAEIQDDAVNNSAKVAKVGRKKKRVLSESTPKSERPAGKKRGKHKNTDLAAPMVKRKRNKIPNYRQLYCEPCDIKFTTKEQSDQHKKQYHSESNLWICEICGKQFAHRGSHFSHVRSHFPPEFGCAHCEYSAWNKSDLIKHIMIHTGIKQYRCEFCPAAYYNSSNLRAHIQRCHEGIKRFSCTMCDAKFFENSKLQRHLDSHNDIKSFVCWNLWMDLVERYDCEVCHGRFSRRCYWKKHLKQQHNIDIPTPRPGKKRNFVIAGALDEQSDPTSSNILDKTARL